MSLPETGAEVSDSATVRIDHRPDRIWVTLDRPAQRNAILTHQRTKDPSV